MIKKFINTDKIRIKVDKKSNILFQDKIFSFEIINTI